MTHHKQNRQALWHLIAFKKRSIDPEQVQDHFGNRDKNFAGLARALPCPNGEGFPHSVKGMGVGMGLFIKTCPKYNTYTCAGMCVYFFSALYHVSLFQRLLHKCPLLNAQITIFKIPTLVLAMVTMRDLLVLYIIVMMALQVENGGGENWRTGGKPMAEVASRSLTLMRDWTWLWSLRQPEPTSALKARCCRGHEERFQFFIFGFCLVSASTSNCSL